RNFAAIQKSLTMPVSHDVKAMNDELMRKVHLVSVSFDPETDTPAVLKRHAESLHADPGRWTFLTGDRNDIETFASRFGVFVTRSASDPGDITHNLPTAIVDADGRLVKVFSGNDWAPPQILSDFRDMATSAASTH